MHNHVTFDIDPPTGKWVHRFLESLPDGREVLMILEEYQNNYTRADLIREKKLKKMRGYNNLYEVRILIRTHAYRLLGVLHKNTLLLVHGFTKQSEHTPRKEIKTALKRSNNIIIT